MTLPTLTRVLGMNTYNAMNIPDISTYGIRSISSLMAQPSMRKFGMPSAMVARKILIPDVSTMSMGKTKNMAR